MAPNDPTAQSDPDRALALLWRHELGEHPPARGPKQKSTVNAVVECGIALADDEGLDAFSMRKVAERLGMGVMSLYTYVPGREELIGLMVDQVTGEVEHPALDGDLRSRLDTVARHLWDEYRRHPWLLQVDTSRPALGPHVSNRYEWELSAVDGVGISDIDMDQVVTLIAGFVSSAARTARDQEVTQQQSGVSDAEWWEVNAPVLEKVMDGSKYPIAGRVGQAAGEAYQAASNPELAFEFGLARVLDGILVFVEAGG
ncbi:TetR/AcrR family transcriptional regulator [Mycetocola zhadangensis]|uniref:TetR/AcrR family transcriptional regulator n=1 Tax=Mycetocola zhadangensis TaxID=1164595 RepID=A0A3L7J1W6_9MICO|nr:TetR/AcrR family transcriptional regulator [Mycetocola zhadangensis]RLQ84558.1 TetR/AcrR family transcriptional regulator [Mycetocola zhadangensis]GGE91891.1 TetR family transcriptional regulator [Mycetocola zhadangensis]